MFVCMFLCIPCLPYISIFFLHFYIFLPVLAAAPDKKPPPIFICLPFFSAISYMQTNYHSQLFMYIIPTPFLPYFHGTSLLSNSLVVSIL